MRKIKIIHLLLLLCCGVLGVQAQNSQRIVGQVKDSSGETLVGVSVMQKGATVGTVTDIDGNYMISTPKTATLVFSYLGFQTQEVAVNGRATVDVVMKESANTLEEVVISVGYGTQRKMTSIGAQSGIMNVAELKTPVANLTNVITGRISGIIGMQRSGDPGNDNADLWIRGISTFTNASPLVLVDGVERDMANINPEDIESFQILKDASATAVYGVKGANGVIMITTKQGTKGKPKVRVEYNFGIKDFTKTPEIADGVTYMQMANEALVTRGEMPLYSEERIRKTYTGEDPVLYPNVKWMDEIFQDFGTTQNVNVSVNGGSEFAQYYVSVGYLDETGMYKITPIGNSTRVHDGSVKYNRYNFTSNLTMQITRTTEAKLGLKGYQSTRTGPHYSAAEIFQECLDTYPIYYPAEFYDGDKLPFMTSGGGMQHPYGMLTQYGIRTEEKNQTYADLRLTQNLDVITKGLSLRGLFSFDNYGYHRIKRYRTPKTYYATGRNDDGSLALLSTDNGNGVDYLSTFEVANEGNRRYYLEGAVNYERNFDNGNHRVSALLLYNQSDYAVLHETTLVAAQPYRSQGLAGRATYSYFDRYLFEANFGYNGSENFHPDKRFGFFPSVGLGWVASNETFWSGVKKIIPFFKIRATWGQSGNDKLDSSRRFAYYDTVGSGNGGYSFGTAAKDVAYSGQAIEDYAVNITWETSTKSNLGIDMRLLDETLIVQFDVFKDRRENIFLQRAAVPDAIGLRKQDWGNLGIIDNWGHEASIDFNKQFGDWFVGIRGNYTFNQSKIIEDDSPSKPYPWLETRGLTRYNRFGFVFEDFYTDAEIQTLRDEFNLPDEQRTLARPTDFDPAKTNYLAGDLKYKDLNGDKIIDNYDRKAIGRDQVPQLVYGFGSTLAWKGWSLGIFFQGVALCDFTLMNKDSEWLIPFKKGQTNGNVYSDITSRWTPENQGYIDGERVRYPRLNYAGAINQNYEMSTFWLQSGAFLRLKTLDFGYTLPNELTKKVGINNCRFYFLGTNLLTFTEFTRYDVELGGSSDAIGKYPNTRTFSLGCNFNF
ncbi:MAG: TonB-dependent receptor [Prevotella sp.]|jgi:TonB-linked SusC/RagA family outer membrane protein|nr:TonB-dependent receptor [Prevotella sp.]